MLVVAAGPFDTEFDYTLTAAAPTTLPAVRVEDRPRNKTMGVTITQSAPSTSASRTESGQSHEISLVAMATKKPAATHDEI